MENNDELLEAQGLNPDEFQIIAATVSEDKTWLRVKRIAGGDVIEPARMPGDYQRDYVPLKETAGSRLVAYLSDQHCPYQDQKLHELTCQWLETYRPDQVVLGGDILEFDTISRWRKKPKFQAVQTGLDAAYHVLRDYVQATPETNFVLLDSNHDKRLQHFILDEAPELYELKAGGKDMPEVLSLEHLLRLDELGIGTVFEETWENAQIAITPYLAARHGYKAHKGAGRTAHATMTELGHSIIVGHVHRQGISYRTIYDTAGVPSVQVGVEAGCMCQLELAQSYATAADWQLGFATISVWDDGRYAVDLASYFKNELHWRGQRFA